MASYIQNVPAQLPNDPQQIDMAEVLRQRRIAEQLAQSSAAPLPAGQMIGNRYVPTAWTQGLANAVGEGLSGYLTKRADTRERELVTERNAKRLAAFKASAGIPDESVVEEGGAPQSVYSGAFNGSVKYDAKNPADYSDASLNPLRNRSTVGVAGQSAPALTERQMIAKRIADVAAQTGQDPYAIMQGDPFIQSDLRIAEAMRTPRELSAGATFGIPGQTPLMTNPKPNAEGGFTAGGVRYDAQGRPIAGQIERQVGNEKVTYVIKDGKEVEVGRGSAFNPNPLVSFNNTPVAVADATSPTGTRLVRQSDAIGQPAPSTATKVTDTERTTKGYHDRMTAAEDNLTAVGKKGEPSIGTAMAGSVPGIGNFARNMLSTQDQQMYRQAQEEWVRAKLRKESGAAIPTDEMDREIATYFPKPGDGPKVIEQKAKTRQVAIKAMRDAAGPAIPSQGPNNTTGWTVR